ncbi:hypothetical protein P3T36_002893 [Kitasatospora sp. MAP12-15]|uniref:hypothetical protein n=1 Tax=unclassified Kitasatospora TaxID=2633591 RepID=UPI002473E95A|nr:hypothetical protein [Kitasatospora sp. MAP12-44]MDH6114072.1 hypothetical protein [Kitasatospora sp. MAP12-44]
MFENKKIRAVVWAGAAVSLVTGGVCAGVAGAASPAPTKATAPYAQAAAVVNADGTIDRSKGVAAVTKVATGRYCVELEDKTLDVSKLVPVATLQLYGFEYNVQVVPRPDPTCGSRADTILVGTGKQNVWADLPFDLVVP